MSVTDKKIVGFISAGEYSGDIIAADLVTSLRSTMPKLKLFGLTGSSMEKAGVESIANYKDFAVMGYAEVFSKLGDLNLLEKRLLAEIDRRQPKFAILIDYPGFHMHLAEQLTLRGVRTIQYVAPKVWAWGENRVNKIREIYDLVLGILPFEQEFFLSNGVNYYYVGSPHIDRLTKLDVNKSLFGINEETKIISLLPGSRLSEIKYIFPFMLQAVNLIKSKVDDLKFVVPLPNSLSINEFFSSISRDVNEVEYRESLLGNFSGYYWRGIHFIKGVSIEIMSISEVAIVASGTATLECALVNTPMVVVYAMNNFTYTLAEKSVNLKNVSLPNLILEKELVKEFIQNIHPKEVATEVIELLEDPEARSRQLNGFNIISQKLQGRASERAAELITEIL